MSSAARHLALLNSCLNSIFRQDSPEWKILLVTESKLRSLSAQIEIISEKVCPLRAKDLVSSQRYDAWMRRKIGASFALAEADCDYLMFVDSDDLVHRGLVSEISRDKGKSSLLINKGYQYYFKFNRIYPLNGTFHAKCGSCVAIQKSVAVREFDLSKSGDLHEFHHHSYLEAAQRHSISLVPFYAAVYCTEHGSNITLGTNRLFIENNFKVRDVGYLIRTTIKCFLGRSFNSKDEAVFGSLHAAPSLVSWRADLD